MSKVTMICQVCGESRIFHPSEIRQGKGRYCSRECSVKAITKEKITTICCNAKCKKPFKTTQWKINHGVVKYCSQKCNYEDRSRRAGIDSVGRICTQCKCKLDWKFFSKGTGPNKKQGVCKKCAAKRLKKAHMKLFTLLHGKKCIDCGTTDMRVLQFDHLPNKDKKKFHIVSSQLTWRTDKEIWDEVSKCEIRCANCHMIKTSERGGHWRTGHKPDKTPMDEFHNSIVNELQRLRKVDRDRFTQLIINIEALCNDIDPVNKFPYFIPSVVFKRDITHFPLDKL